MTNPTVILNSDDERRQAINWVIKAPNGCVVTFKKPARTIPQNDRMWAMLTDIARQATHHGQRFTPDEWKAIFMHAAGREAAFLPGLSGGFFPVGFRSSKLSKEQMGELMDFMEAWAAQNGVRLREVV